MLKESCKLLLLNSWHVNVSCFQKSAIGTFNGGDREPVFLTRTRFMKFPKQRGATYERNLFHEYRRTWNNTTRNQEELRHTTTNAVERQRNCSVKTRPTPKRQKVGLTSTLTMETSLEKLFACQYTRAANPIWFHTLSISLFADAMTVHEVVSVALKLKYVILYWFCNT